MSEPTRSDALSAVLAVTTALDGVKTELARINKRQNAQERYGKRSRLLVLTAAVFTVVDIIGTSLAILAIVVALHANGRAAVATARATVAHQVSAGTHDELLLGCQLSNKSKVEQRNLWTFIEGDIKPTAQQTPAQRKATEKFAAQLRTRVRQAYPVRDCQTAYKAR